MAEAESALCAIDSLATLLSVDRDERHIVARSAEGVLNHQQWLQKIVHWRRCIQMQSAQTWVLCHDDAGEFSAILFALWSLGKTIYLPGNKQPAVLHALEDKVDAFIGDIPSEFSTCSGESSKWEEIGLNDVRELATLHLQMDEPLLYIYTSGSSGEALAIAKIFRQFDEELQHLQTMWGSDEVHVVSTVSHQHIYGLLFGVLWPLSAGNSFAAQRCEYIEQLSECIHGVKNICLISSPTHLSRMPQNIDQCIINAV
ncbi:MAG: hypothetical protein HRU15_19540, partial [Planctomycetes bacterium]|nr:hypothetical protein [Planctomycetota bacterium]